MGSVDLKARKIVMAATLYYGCGLSIISDDEFDKLCRSVAKRWHKLDRYRQWQLGGSPDDLKATAYHVRVSMAAASGAYFWAQAEGLIKGGRLCYSVPPQRSKRYGVGYWSPSDWKYYTEKEFKNASKGNERKSRRPKKGNHKKPRQRVRLEKGRPATHTRSRERVRLFV